MNQHDPFAEIEVASEKADYSISPKAQIIGGSTADPIRQKFYDMRGMASDNPYSWYSAHLFYRQAKFMETFTDEYEGSAEFSMHNPCFQRMGYERLRTYFTWRTKARRGEFTPVSLSYIFLYIYELLACIGTKTPVDALTALVALRGEYADKFPVLNDYLLPWLRDFFIYYEQPQSFNAFIEINNLRGFFNETLLNNDDSSLEAWNKVSNYDITKSKFYNENAENAELLKTCFNTSIRGITLLCANKNLRLKDLFIHTGNQEIPWVPFRRALFHPWLSQPNRRVELGGDIFNCENNNWTTLYAAPYSHRKDLAGFIIKKTESCVRDATDFKTKITADSSTLFKSRTALSELGLTISEIEHTITHAIAEYFKEKNRIVVSVDRKNLERIREESEDITDKLIVEETEKEAPFINNAASMRNDPNEAVPENTKEAFSGDFELVSCTWDGLKESLTATENEAIQLIISENGDLNKIKAFADSKGIMLEILVDNINEKAIDSIGDNILELSNVLEIYSEYTEKVRDMIYVH